MDRANRDELLRMAGTPADAARSACCVRSTPARRPTPTCPTRITAGPGGFDEVFDICERACAGLLDHLRRSHGADMGQR